MRLVPVNSIKIGSVLARIVYDEYGRILLNQGIELTESLIKRLIENQVVAVHIHDSYSTTEIADVISPELRITAVKEIKTVFNTIKGQVEKSIRTMEADKGQLSKRLDLMVEQKYLQGLDNIISNMINEITLNKDAMTGLVDIKNMKSFVYQHSIEVTVLSLLMGASLKMNKYMLKDLAIGAMLHDIGLTLLPKELVTFNSSFSDEEKTIYHSHAQLGFDFIKENSNLSVHARMGILQHHEEYSGNGYPLGLKEDHIHINARIISLANTYDRMASGMNGFIVPPNEIIEFIMGNSGKGRRFDFDIANQFVRKVIPFPPGSHVLLSTGDKAIVVSLNQNHPLRPILKVLIPNKKIDTLDFLDLLDSDKLNITIKKIIYD